MTLSIELFFMTFFLSWKGCVPSIKLVKFCMKSISACHKKELYLVTLGSKYASNKLWRIIDIERIILKIIFFYYLSLTNVMICCVVLINIYSKVKCYITKRWTIPWEVSTRYLKKKFIQTIILIWYHLTCKGSSSKIFEENERVMAHNLVA